MAILSSLFNIGTQYPSAPPQGVAVTQQKLAEEISPFYKDLLAKSQALFEDRTDEGFVPYTGPTMAPFSPQQEQAFTGIESLVGTQAPQFQEATDLVRGTTQEFTPEVAQGLMNPFQQAVTDIEKREAQRDFEANVLPKVRQAQIAQGSFGGTRGSLIEAEALRNQQQQLGDIQARGSLQAYQDAQNIFKDQAAREAAAAGQLATFAPAQYKASVGELGALQSVGEEQQRQQQSALDEAYRQFLEEKRFPEDTLGRYQATVQGFPALRQEISKVTPPQPSMANQLIGGLGTIGSLYGAYGGFTPSGFGSALPGYGPVKRASGGLVSLQQGDSVERAMGEQEAARNLRGINRGLELEQVRQQVPTMEREVREAFINEFYMKANEARESEQGKKDFLDKYGVGGTERLTAEIIFGINDLPNEAAPFRVDEAAIESGIPPAGMAQSYEELEDKFLQDESFPPLARGDEPSGGLSGIFDRLIGRAQGGPILYRKTPGDLQATGRYGKYGTSDVPQALLQFGVSIEELFRRPPDQIVGLYDSLANKPGGGEARYFIRQNFPQLKDQLQIDFTDEDRYGALGRYLPKRGDVQNVISGIGNVVDRVTSQPIEDTVGDIVGKYQSIAKKIPESKEEEKKDTEKKEDITQVAENKATEQLTNLEKNAGLPIEDNKEKRTLLSSLIDANKKAIEAENKVLNQISKRDDRIAERIKNAPQQVKTDLFALAAEKFTDLMQSTEKTVPALAKGVGEFVKEGTGIGKEAQAGELDLENMAVDSLKDQAKVLGDQFTRTATITAGGIDLEKIKSDAAVKGMELMSDREIKGNAAFDKQFSLIKNVPTEDVNNAMNYYIDVYRRTGNLLAANKATVDKFPFLISKPQT